MWLGCKPLAMHPLCVCMRSAVSRGGKYPQINIEGAVDGAHLKTTVSPLVKSLNNEMQVSSKTQLITTCLLKKTDVYCM